nr:hypothetical protein BaRGS_017955 [Batillaria attramentaria]
MAGFLGFVSSEVSAFAICLVTLDRFLVLCFPLKSNLHMKTMSAATACIFAWVAGVMLAAVPLMAQWEFYGQSGICLPLPITRQQYQGQQYAFGIFIVLNFVLFLLIGTAQVFIYLSVRVASSKFGTDRRQQELTIARRLFLIVFTDFLCWFPIGLLGLLANHDLPIPGEANVWAAIFVLPLNSALNPFLYTLNGLAERREKQREAARMRKMLAKLHSEIPKWTPAAVEELTRICLRSRHVKKEHVLQLLGADTCVSTENRQREASSTQRERDPSDKAPFVSVVVSSD